MDTSSFFTVPAGDFSLKMLNAIFDQSNLFTSLLGYYNAIVAIGSLFLFLYIALRAVVDTAHTGKAMGHYNEAWLVVRLTLGIVLVCPLPGGAKGLNAAQFAIYGVAKLGIGGADYLWGQTIDGLTTSATPIVAPPAPDAEELAHGLWRMAVCEAAANSLASAAGSSPWVIEHTTTTTSNTYLTYDGDRAQGFSEAFCGAVVFAVQQSSAPSTANSLYQAQQDATNQLMTVVKGVASTLVADVITPHGAALPAAGDIPSAIQGYGSRMQQLAGSAATNTADTTAFATNAKAQGWVSAGSYVMQISDVNASILRAAGAVPNVHAPTLANGLSKNTGVEMIRIMSAAEQWWQARIARATPSTTGEGNADDAALAGQDVWTWLHKFGLRASLFKTFVMDQNTQTNPIANAVSMGHSMLDAFWAGVDTMFASSVMTEAAQAGGSDWLAQVGTLGLSGVAGQTMAGVLHDFLWVIIMILMSLFASGVWYAYLLPAIPFLFWFKGIERWFHAIVVGCLAAPAWGLAHLRGGEQAGAISQEAMTGYATLVEILLRPIIMVMTFVAAFLVSQLAASYVFPFFTQMISNNLDAHGDMFTGAIVYTYLGAIALSGILVMSFGMAVAGVDGVMRHMGLSSSSDRTVEDVREAAGQTNAVGEKAQGLAQQTVGRPKPGSGGSGGDKTLD